MTNEQTVVMLELLKQVMVEAFVHVHNAIDKSTELSEKDKARVIHALHFPESRISDMVYILKGATTGCPECGRHKDERAVFCYKCTEQKQRKRG